MSSEPSVLDDIRDAIGEDLTDDLVDAFGGTRIWLTERKEGPAYMRVCEVIGKRAATLLSERFGGSVVYIPRNVARRRSRRDAEIVAKYRAGVRLEKLARDYNTGETNIRRIIKAH